MATKDELLSDVLKLPPEERAEFAHKLLLSLDEEEETVPWSKVEARLSARLRRR
ncbi:MAG: hypothetical protein ACJ8AT_09470 [Hyalangium sp.]|uniref:hypothetical protein n=1 Tax=Hyalangium sp. TaxID=2028555 RepID=UPI00389AF1A0